MKPCIVFAACALLASIGGWLLVSSNGGIEQQAGCVMLVFFGLGAIALPGLVGRPGDAGHGEGS